MAKQTKVLLVAINAKYTHTNLAVRYVKAYADKYIAEKIADKIAVKNEFDISYMEYTINQTSKNIMNNIYQQAVDVLIFSCYIWNINMVMEITKSLKKVKPKLQIVLAGPEVSFDHRLLEQSTWIDSVIFGEGEQAFIELITDYHTTNNIKKSGYSSELLVTSQLVSAYYYYDIEMLRTEFANRTLYYETSRGCPYSCAYCLSGAAGGVRFFPLEIVFADIEQFISAKVKQVKFVDRTFNCNPERARTIFSWLLAKAEQTNIETNFHFEIAGDLLNEETIELLATSPEGLFQFEIGVQTTNPETIAAIKRQNEWSKIKKNVEKIKSKANIHVHLDLIAGLPKESIQEFAKSFDDVYQLRPHMLQLGFLKLLKGSQLRTDADKYGIIYKEAAPYEVLQTADLSYDDIITLHEIEHVVEHYYNSRQFNNTIEWLHSITSKNLTGFKLYQSLASFLQVKHFFEQAHSQQTIFSYLYQYIELILDHNWQQLALARDLLRFDFLLLGAHAKLPKFLLEADQNIGISLPDSEKKQFFYNQTVIDKYAPHLLEKNMRERNKGMQLAVFQHDVLQANKQASNFQKSNTVILFVYNKDRLAFNRAKVYNVSNYFKDILQ